MHLHGIDNRLQRGAVVSLDDSRYVIVGRSHRRSAFCIPLQEPQDWLGCEAEILYTVISFERMLTQEESLTHWHPVVRKTCGTKFAYKWTLKAFWRKVDRVDTLINELAESLKLT